MDWDHCLPQTRRGHHRPRQDRHNLLEPVVHNIISSLYQLLIDCEVNTGLLSYFQILCVICGT